jgi:hypothetical protein
MVRWLDCYSTISKNTTVLPDFYQFINAVIHYKNLFSTEPANYSEI